MGEDDKKHGNNNENTNDLFTEIDSDGDGYITGIEILKWMKKMNMEHDFGTVAAIMKYFDADGDGRITVEDVLQKNDPNNLTGGMSCLPSPLKGIISIPSDFVAERNAKPQPRKKTENVLEFLGMQHKFLGKYRNM